MKFNFHPGHITTILGAPFNDILYSPVPHPLFPLCKSTMETQEEYLKCVQMDSANTFLLLILKSLHSIPCLLIGPRAVAGSVL